MQHTQEGGAKRQRKKNTPQTVKKEKGWDPVLWVSEQSCLSPLPTSEGTLVAGLSLVESSSCWYQKNRIWRLDLTLRGHHIHHLVSKKAGAHPLR